MTRVLAKLSHPKVWPLLVVGLAALVLAPRVWSYGFWDPQEIAVADKAREVAKGAPLAETVGAHPPFTVWVVAKAISSFGTSELVARLPLVLLGVLVALGCFVLGTRLANRRAGLLAALVAIGSPLLVFESRQLISSLGATAGNLAIVLGAVGLIAPGDRRGRRVALYGLDAALVAAGAVLGYSAAGGLVGVAAPLLAVAAACVVAARQSRADRGPSARTRTDLAAAVAVAAALVAVAWVALSVVDLVEASVGDRAIAGTTIRVAAGYSHALGGTWRMAVPESVTWDAVLPSIAYGMFPWVALTPFALARAAGGDADERRRFGAYLVFLWSFVAWAAATLVTLKAGHVRYPALPALAVVVGIWLDAILAARVDATGRPAVPTQLPLAGLAVALLVLMLGKDIREFHDSFAAVHLLDGSFKWPDGISRGLTYVPLAFGVVFGAAMCVGLWHPLERPAPPPSTDDSPLDRLGAWVYQRIGAPLARAFSMAGQHGIVAAVGVALALAATLSWVYTPTLSRAFSYKHLFDRYRELRGDADRLGILGMPGSGPAYYARGDYTPLANRDALLDLLDASERAFAMVPARDLCSLHQATAARGSSYHVLDNSHAQFLLVSNQLGPAEVDHNPLHDAIRRDRPDEIQTPLSARFENAIELVGVTMPAEVSRGQTFEMALYFKVLEQPKRNWQIFVHFDSGLRFQGDHWPIHERCGTNQWQAGDYIVDRFEVTAGDLISPRSVYKVWGGFFVGSSGNWTNMKVESGETDGKDRVAVGTLRVK